MLEDEGDIYKDTARTNETRTADAILADGGMNSVRLRIWVNPVDGIYGLRKCPQTPGLYVYCSPNT